ncbi:hypothetical protein A9Q99_26370 [Gammaproteobacteria bacterium 45_16_T64]|nr:hypothetical protein A9Q99_26370 [Gammaproteobacteria bacterium 45_16_T64]
MNKFSLSILFSSILLATAGCGGSGSSSSVGSSNTDTDQGTTEQTSEPQSRSGKLLGLQGFTYQSGELEGITSEDGEFEYQTGETVSFYLGDILLGTATPADYLTLEDIAGEHADAADNLRRFLATVDYDLAPMNGILVNSTIRTAAKGHSLNFDQDSANFISDATEVLQTDVKGEVHSAALKHGLEILLPQIEERKTQTQARLLRTINLPKIPYDTALAEEAAAVIELMLQNSTTEGDSPLEFILKATSTPLVLESDDESVTSLTELYAKYKGHLDEIGRDAPFIDREELISKPAATGDSVDAHHLLVMSDFQMRDEESPLNVNPVKFLIPSSYYPASAHITYQVDDMVRTMRDYETDIDKPIDMAIFTGDLLDIGGYNEARWGIDILDGGAINPDSGADDDPIPGNFDDGKPNDTYDPFTALGLNGQSEGQANIPWYYVPGNHDGLMLGNFPVTDNDLQLFGKTIRLDTRTFFDSIATGEMNWLGYDPSLLGFLQHLFDPESFYVTPDEDRRMLRPFEIAEEMFISKDPAFASEPLGHGMQHIIDQQGELKDGNLNYSFSSNNGLVKHIALDTSMMLGPEGLLTLQDLAWIEQELQDAQDNGQLIIISSHHKPKDIIINGALLIDTLNQYPNVIAHLVAHAHQNSITPRLGDSAELGYWEIESGSMVNWPQQFRVLDISIDKTNGIGTIKSTMLNHKSESPLHVAQRGRFLSYLERYLEGHILVPGDAIEATEGLPEDRNTFMYFKVPDNVLTRL